MINISSRKKFWIGIALINLAIVAVLGFVLRSKILFSMPFVDYKNTLHAHSHFAFGGWVTVALLTLLTYEVLPVSMNRKPVYKWFLAGILMAAIGMLISFPVQGYGFYSILFSTLFIFVTYGYSYVFVKDVLKTKNSKTIKLLSIASVIYLVISSVGPFTLAYLLATKSGNAFLYRDSIYTYLHLQYNGFFTLAIMALLFNRIEHLLPKAGLNKAYKFAHILNLTVLPSMFLCYLWHYPNTLFRVIALAGSLSLVVCTVYFFTTAYSIRHVLEKTTKPVKIIGMTALAAFILKMAMQAFTIFPALGDLIFANRPMIIAFLHLVLLGFVSLYLIAHFLYAGYMPTNRRSITAVYVFTFAVVANEVVLFMQGTGVMFMTNSALYAQLLWGTGAALLGGAILMVRSYYTAYPKIKPVIPVQQKSIIESQRKNYNKYE